MFMPHAKPKEPDFVGVNSSVVVANGARDLLAWKSGNTTRSLQSLASCRSNTSRRGTLLDDPKISQKDY